MNEALWYMELARRNYPDDYADLIESFGPDGRQIAAETAYIYEHGKVPDWAVHIDRFEIVNGSYLFVHRKPTVMN